MVKGNDSYQTDRILREYLLFHYGSEQEILSLGVGPRDALGFSVRSVQLLIDENSIPPPTRVSSAAYGLLDAPPPDAHA